MAYTVLVPVDDTTWTPGFISYLDQFATNEDCGFVLLRVIPDLTGIGSMDREQHLLEAEGLLEECAKQLAISRDRIWFNIEMGKPETVIPHRAMIERADLIVMTTHARKGISRILEGSVAESVMRIAPCPTLLCHTDVEPHPQLSDSRPLRVLVPLDNTRESAQILDAVIGLIPASNREIILYHALKGSSESDASGGGVEQEKAFIETCKQRLEHAGYRTRTVTTPCHSATSDIITKISELNVDMAAMATHGRSGLSRLLFGSVAESIMKHSNVPLLTVSTAPTLEATYQERYIG